jgi:hypothetical protein
MFAAVRSRARVSVELRVRRGERATMSMATPRMAVLGGDGLVGRFGVTALLIARYVPDQEEFVEQLLATVGVPESEASPLEPPLSHRIGELLLRTGSGAAASFGVVSPVESGVQVLLRGAVDASIKGPDGEQLLSGREAVTWADRVVAAPFERIAVAQAGVHPARLDPRLDLRRGLVWGGGFALVPGEVPAEASSRKREREGVEHAIPEPSERAAVVGEAESRPAASGAARPGVSLTAPPGEARRARAPTRAAATVAGTGAPAELVGGDGSRTPIDREYVLGREPTADVAVASGTASPLPIDDPEGLVSRVHARVWVQRGVVFVRDGRSAHGTFLAAPGAQEWTRVGPEGTELPLEWSILVGSQIFTLENAAQPSPTE